MVVDHIQELVESAGSLEDLRDNLITLLPDMPLDKFAEVMQWALAGGNLVGRVEAQEDADG